LKEIIMDLPRAKDEITYGHDGPPVFGCPELETSFYRLRASWAPARKEAGGLTLLGEEADWRSNRRKIFVLWFQEYNDTGELLVKLQELVREYQIQDVYARLTRVEHYFLSYFNSEQKFRRRISTRRPPRADDSGCIDYHLNLVNELLRPGRERVYFPNGSNIPQILQSLTDDETAHGITDIDHPAAASLVYGITALFHYSTYEAPESRGYQKSQKYNPFRILETRSKGLKASDPWRILDNQ